MNKVTITIAIPAYNEESNITNVLKSATLQVGNFILKKIIVMSDGSADKTVQKVNDFKKKHKKVELIHEDVRRGKAFRLNQLFKANKSDYLVIFDADILIPDNNVVEKMIKKFADNVVLVSGNNLPIEGKTFWGKLSQYSEELWYYARTFYNDGESYYNNSGDCFAIKKSFAQSISLPKNSIHNQLYIYYEVAKHNKLFSFAREAKIFYKTPSSLEDIIAHHARGKTSYIIENKINKLLKKEEEIPVHLKIYAIIIMLQKNIFYTVLTLIYLKIMAMLPIKADPLSKKGQWKIIKSSKQYA